MLRVIICDDEPLAVERLERMVNNLGNVEVLQSLSSGEQLLAQLEQSGADLVLLDIEMPRLDGFDVVEAISRMNWADGHEPPLIVFVTAHSEFAVKAFDSGALDFIGKPVRLSRLERALQRARVAVVDREARRRLSELTEQLEELKRIHSDDKDEPYVWLRKGAEVRRLDLKRVDWISAEGEYVRFHSGEESYLERGSITEVAERFEPSGFVRIHRSTIVNAAKIKSVKRSRWGSIEICLKSGAELRVSKSYRKKITHIIALP